MAKKQVKKETVEEKNETLEVNNVDNNKETTENIVETTEKVVETTENNKKEDDEIKGLGFFHLNEKLKSIENVIAYYIATAKANEGAYPHNTTPIYQYSMKKITQLELKKVELLDIMEKKILS